MPSQREPVVVRRIIGEPLRFRKETEAARRRLVPAGKRQLALVVQRRHLSEPEAP